MEHRENMAGGGHRGELQSWHLHLWEEEEEDWGKTYEKEEEDEEEGKAARLKKKEAQIWEAQLSTIKRGISMEALTAHTGRADSSSSWKKDEENYSKFKSAWSRWRTFVPHVASWRDNRCGWVCLLQFTKPKHQRKC